MRFLRSQLMVPCVLGAAFLTIAACGVPNPQAGQVIVIPSTTRYAPHGSAETARLLAPTPPSFRPLPTEEPTSAAPATSADPPLALSAADAALHRADDVELMDAAMMIAAAKNAEVAAPDVPSSVVMSASPPLSQTTPAATSANSNGQWSWTCVATAETGYDTTMHGSAYSSMYGVMNEAVRENAPPAVADAILNGTATIAEQTAMAQSIVDKFGITAWAAGTVAKCRGS